MCWEGATSLEGLSSYIAAESGKCHSRRSDIVELSLLFPIQAHITCLTKNVEVQPISKALTKFMFIYLCLTYIHAQLLLENARYCTRNLFHHHKTNSVSLVVLRDHNWFKVTKGLLTLNGDLMLVPLVSIQNLTLKYLTNYSWQTYKALAYPMTDILI